MTTAFLIFAGCFLMFVYVNWFVIYPMLRIDRPDSYYLERVMIEKSFHLFPSSYNYSYPEGHEGHNGFSVDWLWFNFSFMVSKRNG